MGKKRERETGSPEGKEEVESEAQPSKKAKVEETTSASEVEDEGGWVKKQKETREKMQLLVSAFSNSQQDQYEIFRRSSFPKSSVKKIMQGVCGSTLPQNAVIAMAGIAKVYVGEVVEAALQAREDLAEDGPLQPKHVREAVRRLKKKRKTPNSRYKKTCPFR